MPIALCRSLNRLVLIWRVWLSFFALVSSPQAPKFNVHFHGPRKVLTPPPTSLKDAKQSVEGPKGKAQPSLPTLSEEDTPPKVFILGGWCKLPEGHPKDAFG